MPPTVHLGFEPNAGFAADVQRAHAFGAVGFMGGEAHQIDFRGRQINLDLARGLRRIDMENHPIAAANIAQRGQVLHHANLIIDQHHRSQNGVRANRSQKGIKVEQAVFKRGQIGDFKPVAFELAAGVEHGLVFGFDRNQVLALGLVKICRAFNRQIIGLGRARGPDDFFGVAVDQLGDFGAGIFNRCFGFPTIGMAAAGGVAKVFAEMGNHDLGHAGVYRCGGGVVEINGIGVGSGVHRDTLLGGI